MKRRSPEYKEVNLDEISFNEDPPPPKRMHVKYEKLVVPSRMRSSYWKYFGFPADEDGKMITKDIVVCGLCKGQMIYNRNTSNLKMHLGSRHKSALQTVEKREERIDGSLENIISNSDEESFKVPGDAKTRQVIISEDTYDSNISIIFPSKEEMPQYESSGNISEAYESTDINDAIMNFLITDLVSPKIVEGKGFNNFVSLLANRILEVPNEKVITEVLIPSLYKTHKDYVFETISSNSSSSISLSFEQWRCLDNALCLSIYVHYLSSERLILNSNLLTSVSFSGDETTEYWSQYLDSIFKEWNINIDSISAVLVAFHNEELKEALKTKNIIMLPCFLFLMQRICSDHCFKQPAVFELLEKCRAVIRHIQEYKVDLAEVAEEFSDADGDENDFILSCDQPELWLTTYYMLRGILRRKQALNNFFATNSFVNPLSSGDWKTLQQLVKCLEPLKTVVLTLFEEKNSLISLIKPLIKQVCSNKFTANQNDASLVRELKSCILKALNDAYEAEEIDSFIQTATKLDPRFKKFLQEDEDDSENKLLNLLCNLVDEQGLCRKSDQDKRRKLSGINALFGNNFSVVKQESSAEAAVKMEIDIYRSRSSALLEECPLEWWQSMKKKCPNLVNLAYRYHCVPAVVLSSFQFDLKNYIVFYSQRASLPLHVADSLLFLNINK